MADRVRELEESRAALIEKANAIRAGATASDRDMSEDETASVDALLDEADGITADVERITAAEDRDARLARHSEQLSRPEERRTTRPTRANGDGSKTTIEVGDPGYVKDPQRGFVNSREFLVAVMQHGQSGRVPSESRDERLRFLAAAGSDEQGTYSDPYGGFLLPDGFSPSMLRVDPEMDPIAGRTTTIPMSSATVKIPARTDKTHTSSVSGGLTVTRRAETTAATASRMEMEQITLTAYSLIGLSYVTEELLTDSPISFAALLAAGFSDEFTSHMINERLNGTGSGMHEGIAVSPALVAQPKETGQAADTIVYENILKMRSRCWGYQNAVWLANHDTMPQLATLNLAVGTGGAPVFMVNAQSDIPDMLMGRPIFFTEYAETVGDKGDIYCVNWTQYLEGTLQPLQSAESIHVRFVNHERTFKFWLRNAGAGWWRSALTPKKSSTTLSPFVTLAARA